MPIKIDKPTLDSVPRDVKLRGYRVMLRLDADGLRPDQLRIVATTRSYLLAPIGVIIGFSMPFAFGLDLFSMFLCVLFVLASVAGMLPRTVNVDRRAEFVAVRWFGFLTLCQMRMGDVKHVELFAQTRKEDGSDDSSSRWKNTIAIRTHRGRRRDLFGTPCLSLRQPGDALREGEPVANMLGAILNTKVIQDYYLSNSAARADRERKVQDESV